MVAIRYNLLMDQTAVPVTIRQASRADAQALSALAVETYTAAFGHSMSAEDLSAQLAKTLTPARCEQYIKEDTVLLAEVDGFLAGYVQFGASGITDCAELRRLYVLARYQNQGIGAQLMEAALACPVLCAALRIQLDVWEHNHGAIRFYERFGFVVVGEQKFTVASGAETSLDLIMVRTNPSSPHPGNGSR